MATITQVANLAAVRIGTEARVTALDDNSSLARTLAAVWDIERRAAIRDGAFNFAKRRWALAARVLAAGETIYPWSYAYPLPAACLRFLEALNLPDQAQ